MPQEAAENTPTAPREKSVPLQEPLKTSPAGRVAVGAVFALGLYLGLRELATSVVLAARYEPDGWWSSFEGLVVVCGAQGLAVLFGAVIAAAGRTGGFMFGAAVGGLCGALFLAAELIAGAPARDLVLYIQPISLVFAGGIAGVFAARIWGAVPILDLPLIDRNKLSSSRFALEVSEDPGRPTVWIRILAGAMIMIASVAVADQVRNQAQKYSGGLLRVTSVGQGRFVTWQIAVMGMLAGGAVAGATTGAGIRHGSLAGAIASVGAVGLSVMRGEPLAPLEYWLNVLSLTGAPSEVAPAVAAVGGVVLFGVLGGWLGGTLFLPLAPEYMRRRLQTGMD